MQRELLGGTKENSVLPLRGHLFTSMHDFLGNRKKVMVRPVVKPQIFGQAEMEQLESIFFI